MKLAKILTAKERTRFEACNKQVRDGLQSCFDTGAALAEVRDHKLYREDYKTFEAYCRETFDVSRAHAYRLISAADIKELSPIGDKIENEGQARAVAKVPEEERETVVESVRGEGVMTARAITGKANKNDKQDQDLSPIGDKVPVRTAAPPVPVKILDETDTLVPEDLQELWARRNEVESKLREIAALANFFKALQASRDPLWIGVAPQAMMMELEHAHQTLGEARLFAVCIVCQGRGRAQCTFCKGKGFISRFRWDQQATIEAKEMRRKANAKRRGA